MNLHERLNGLTSAFNLVWKICLLIVLMWIGLNLHLIVTGGYHGEWLPGSTDPASQNNDSLPMCPSDKPQT